MKLLYIALFLILLGVSFNADAYYYCMSGTNENNVCTDFQMNQSGGPSGRWRTSQSEAQSAYFATDPFEGGSFCSWTNGPNWPSPADISGSGNTATLQDSNMTYDPGDGECDHGRLVQTKIGCPDGVDCEGMDMCGEMEGKQFNRAWHQEEYLDPGSSLCVASCEVEEQAVMRVTVGGPTDPTHGYALRYEYTGGTCGPTHTGIEGKLAASSESAECVKALGTDVCFGQMTKQEHAANCGTIDGEWICLESVPDDTCVVLEGGGGMCTGSTEQDAKDRGPTEGENDDPVHPITCWHRTTDEGDEYGCYYSEVQLDNSTTNVITSGGSGSGGGDGGGDLPDGDSEGGEDGPGDGDGAGGDPMDGDDGGDLDGDGDTGEGGGADGPGNFGALGSINTATFDTTGVTCPQPTFEVFEEQYTLDYHCTLFDEHGQGLTILFMFIWTIAAVRVVLSA